VNRLVKNINLGIDSNLRPGDYSQYIKTFLSNVLIKYANAE